MYCMSLVLINGRITVSSKRHKEDLRRYDELPTAVVAGLARYKSLSEVVIYSLLRTFKIAVQYLFPRNYSHHDHKCSVCIYLNRQRWPLPATGLHEDKSFTSAKSSRSL
jgi:hypothetical protein